MEEKRKMENDLRFFKVDFAKMVADKEDAITQLGNARLVISDLQEQIEKKNLADKSDTNIHQVLRLKAEKERDQEKEEKVKLVQEMDKIKQEKSMLLEEKEKWKQEKRHLEYTIGDLFKEKEATKGKIRKIKEIVDEWFNVIVVVSARVLYLLSVALKVQDICVDGLICVAG